MNHCLYSSNPSNMPMKDVEPRETPTGSPQKNIISSGE
jgi:hypothetical protein